MFFDCKVFDPEGNLKTIVKAEELAEKHRVECASILDAEDRRAIKNFDLTPLEEYEVRIGYSE